MPCGHSNPLHSSRARPRPPTGGVSQLFSIGCVSFSRYLAQPLLRTSTASVRPSVVRLRLTKVNLHVVSLAREGGRERGSEAVSRPCSLVAAMFDTYRYKTGSEAAVAAAATASCSGGTSVSQRARQAGSQPAERAPCMP